MLHIYMIFIEYYLLNMNINIFLFKLMYPIQFLWLFKF